MTQEEYDRAREVVRVFEEQRDAEAAESDEATAVRDKFRYELGQVRMWMGNLDCALMNMEAAILNTVNGVPLEEIED